MTADATRKLTRLAVVLVAFAYAATVMLSCPDRMASGDSAYHFVTAARIWGGNLAPDPGVSFPWTIFRDMPFDHYWGFHFLLSPFAMVPDQEIGMKLATATLFAVLLGVLHEVLSRRKVPFPWVWTFASVLFSTQDWRYLQLRGGVTTAALLLVFLEVAFFVERPLARRLAIGVLAWFAMLSYQGALVLIPFHVVGLFGLAVGRQWRALRARALEPVVTAVGLLLGTIVNPYMGRSFAPLRFAIFHTWNAGSDPTHLFAGRENVEFSPFPAHALVTDWGWSVLLVLVVATVAWVALQIVKRRAIETDTLIYACLTMAGTVFVARAIRMREYAVPVAFVFFACVARDAVRVNFRRWMSPMAAAVILVAGYLQAIKTRQVIETVSKPLGSYAGARTILEAYKGAPVINIVQGDSTFLMWEWHEVQVAHVLNPYFIYFHDRPLYDDLNALQHPTDDETALASLGRLASRGSRLVAARDGLAFHAIAQRHPDRLRRVYLNPRYGGALYEIRAP